MKVKHIPVLLNEVLSYINYRENGIYVDATLGNGGHSLNLLKNYPKVKTVVGIDRDEESIKQAAETLQEFKDKTILVNANFKDIRKVLDEHRIEKIDGIIFDLGVSMSQIKDPSRGFSFREEGALDMRMDRKTSLTAEELIKNLSENELEKLLKEYGEERWAKRIARSIKQAQQQAPLKTTTELARIIERSVPSKHRIPKIHPATKTFQALRIAVNSELDAIQETLNETIDILNPGGRVCVITFHSLEDRIVKDVFRTWAKSCICPKNIVVCVCNKKSMAKIITGKPVIPSSEEIIANPSSRSAKLRVAERT